MIILHLPLNWSSIFYHNKIK
ncbi:hypothetical protein ACJIZ3_002858 [Penstemon smallii]|uniref:Uncharacterized protein n=1 Tax=Penstemon smallii TaxID=265156 RepID=A0ABD3UAL5_9LAMI